MLIKVTELTLFTIHAIFACASDFFYLCVLRP